LLPALHKERLPSATHQPFKVPLHKLFRLEAFHLCQRECRADKALKRVPEESAEQTPIILQTTRIMTDDVSNKPRVKLSHQRIQPYRII
jgi:hypothetical protein